MPCHRLSEYLVLEAKYRQVLRGQSSQLSGWRQRRNVARHYGQFLRLMNKGAAIMLRHQFRQVGLFSATFAYVDNAHFHDCR